MNRDINKQLADFNLNSTQKKAKTTIGQRNADFDDSRSDCSYISNQSYGAASSNFSSALKRNNPAISGAHNQQALLNASQMSHDVSSCISQITYEDGCHNAEMTAIEEEERARRRQDDKQRKLKEFQKHTQTNANKKLREDIAAKERAEQERQIKDKERMAKAKEYSKKQREIVASKGQRKVGRVEVLSESAVSYNNNENQDPAGAHTNFHSQFQYQNNRDLNEVIPEESETDGISQLNEQVKGEEKNAQINLKDLYQRIDQEELEKIGVNNKQDVSEQALVDLHQYSMLQRFRNNKDFKGVDKYKPKMKATAANQADKENKWWLGNQDNSAAQKQKLEKQRYLKALKALVYEKGSKLDGREIPSLCSCGALNENLKSMKKGQDIQQMCASNCQFYKNEKDYEKALGDILHSISQFK